MNQRQPMPGVSGRPVTSGVGPYNGVGAGRPGPAVGGNNYGDQMQYFQKLLQPQFATRATAAPAAGTSTPAATVRPGVPPPASAPPGPPTIGARQGPPTGPSGRPEQAPPPAYGHTPNPYANVSQQQVMDLVRRGLQNPQLAGQMQGAWSQAGLTMPNMNEISRYLAGTQYGYEPYVNALYGAGMFNPQPSPYGGGGEGYNGV